MKWKLTIALLFLCGISYSQIYTPLNPSVYGSNNLRLKASLALNIPEKDTLLTNTTDTTAQIFYYKKDKSIYYWSSKVGYKKVVDSLGFYTDDDARAAVASVGYLTGTFNEGQVPFAHGGSGIHSMSNSQIYQTSDNNIMIGPGTLPHGQRLEVSGTITATDYLGIHTDTAQARLHIKQDTGISAAAALRIGRSFSPFYNDITSYPSGQWVNTLPNKSGTFALTSDYASFTDSLSNVIHKTGDETKTGKLAVTDSLYSTNSVSLKRSGYSLAYTTPNVSSGVGETQGIAYDSVGNAYIIGTNVLRKYDSSHTTVLANNTTPFTGLTYTYVHFNDGDIYKSKLAIPTYALSPTYKKALLIYNLDLSFFKELRIPDVVGGISAGSIQKDTLYMASYEDPASYKIWKYLVPDYGSAVDSVTLIDSLVFAPQGDIWRVQGIKVVNDTIFSHTDQGEVNRCSLDGSNFRPVYKLAKPDYFINGEGLDWVNGQLRLQYDSTGVGLSTHIAYINPIANVPIISVSRDARLKVNGITDFNGNVNVNGNVAIQSKSYLDFVLNRKNKPDFRIGQIDRLGMFSILDSTLTAKFTIAQGGNVGIGLGNTKASSTLQVNGSTSLGSLALSGALTSTSTGTFSTTIPGAYSPLTFTNSATAGSSVNGIEIPFNVYNGTSVTTLGAIALTSSVWTFGATFVANQMNVRSAGSGGLGFRNTTGDFRFYSGNANAWSSPEVLRISSTGAISNTAAAANANSVLDLASTTKGVMLPRMNRTQFAAITATQGNLAYSTLLDKFVYSNGTAVKVIDDSSTVAAKYRQLSDTAASGTSTATINQLQKRIDSLGVIISTKQNTDTVTKVTVYTNQSILGNKRFVNDSYFNTAPAFLQGFYFDHGFGNLHSIVSTSTTNRIDTVPDKSGTFAMTSDLLKTGIAFFSGNGVTTTFDITLPSTPTWANAEATSTDASNITYRTPITGGIRIFYTVAPPSGTNNISITYMYK